MNTNLENRVKGQRRQFFRNTMLAGAIIYGSFKIGQFHEAKTDKIDNKPLQKEIHSAVIDEGYGWREGSHHKFYELEPVLMKDPKTKQMWGEFVHDTTYFGRVRDDGNIGMTSEEKVVDYQERVLEKGKNAWDKSRDWLREKINYVRKDEHAKEQ